MYDEIGSTTDNTPAHAKTYIPCTIHNSGKYICCDCASIDILKKKIQSETLKREVARVQMTIDTILDKSISVTAGPAFESPTPAAGSFGQEYEDGIRLLQNQMILLKIKYKKRDISELKTKIKTVESKIIRNLKLKDQMFKNTVYLPLLNSSVSSSIPLNQHNEAEIMVKITEVQDKIALFRQVLRKNRFLKFKSLTDWINITYNNTQNCYYFNNLVPLPQHIKKVSELNMGMAPGFKSHVDKPYSTHSNFLLDLLETFLKTSMRIHIDEYSDPDFYNSQYQKLGNVTAKTVVSGNKQVSKFYGLLISKMTFIIFACFKILRCKGQLVPISRAPDAQVLPARLSQKDNKKLFTGLFAQTNYLGKLLYATCQPWEYQSEQQNEKNLLSPGGSLVRSTPSIYSIEYIDVPRDVFVMGDLELIQSLNLALLDIVDNKAGEEKWMLIK